MVGVILSFLQVAAAVSNSTSQNEIRFPNLRNGIASLMGQERSVDASTLPTAQPAESFGGYLDTLTSTLDSVANNSLSALNEVSALVSEKIRSAVGPVAALDVRVESPPRASTPGGFAVFKDAPKGYVARMGGVNQLRMVPTPDDPSSLSVEASTKVGFVPLSRRCDRVPYWASPGGEEVNLEYRHPCLQNLLKECGLRNCKVKTLPGGQLELSASECEPLVMVREV